MFNATITGHLGKDPEQRTFNDMTVTRFSVGVRTMKKDKETGLPISEWVEVSIWGKRGDYWKDVLHKGSRIIATGDLTHSSYVNKNGETVFTTELNCTGIENLTPRDAQSGTAASAPNAGGITEVEDNDELPF